MFAFALRHWNNYWFRPVGPLNLAISRILFCACMILWFPFKSVRGWENVPIEMWRPIPLFRLLQFSPIRSSEFYFTLETIVLVGLALTCIGFLTRFASLVAFLVGIYVIGFQHNFGHAFHKDCVPLVVMGILAFTRCADVLSVDRWIKDRMGWTTDDAPSGTYAWPLRLIVVYMVLCYLPAGICKMQTSGLAWVFSDNLKWSSLRQFYVEAPIPMNLGYYVAKSYIACVFFGIAAIVVEAGAPAALFHPVLKFLVAIGLIGMQLYIYVAMAPNFILWMICFFFWVPWEDLIRRFRPNSLLLTPQAA